MNILEQLSSQTGDRTQKSNELVALQCRDMPPLLDDIAEGLKRSDAKLLGDCAEVMTMVAEHQPELVVPYVDLLIPLLTNRTMRVRWEAMHAVALVADRVPEKAPDLLPILHRAIQGDKSVIARDYAVKALGNLAKANESLARQVYPLLKESLFLWEGKQAKLALIGLGHVSTSVPTLASEVRRLGQKFMDHPRPSVRKAARALSIL